MNTGAIKTGVLSFGMSGKLFHCPFLHAHPQFELRAVVERTKKEAQSVYEGILSYGSVDEILADAAIELIVVNTPNLTHCDFALAALRAGKHVLMEKPFTITSNEAEMLFEEARKCNRCILPYQNRRYDSDFLSVKEVLDSGQLGRLVEFHLRYDRYKYSIGPKAMKESPVPGSGLLFDLGPHLLDAVLSLFGSPLEWRKTKGHFRKHTQVDDYAHIHLLFPEGLNVFLSMSLLVADAQPAFVLHGTQGSFIKQRADVQEKQLLEGMSPLDAHFGIEDPEKEGLLSCITEEGRKEQEKIVAPKGAYVRVFDNIYQSIREGKVYPVSQEQIIQQLEILES